MDEPTLGWLADYRFSGDVSGIPRARRLAVPVLVVEGAFGEAVLLETVLLSILLNHDSAIASAAARIDDGGRGRASPASRSVTPHRAERGDRLRARSVRRRVRDDVQPGGRSPLSIPTSGTEGIPHAAARHRARRLHRVESLGVDTTLLVDTYDVTAAVRLAIEVAGTGLGAVRLDSGDLPLLADQVRRQLDDLRGDRHEDRVVIGGLDEYAIAGLAAAPVDGYGVGTSLVTGSGHPTCGFVYSSSPAPTGPVRTRRWYRREESKDKISVGSRKYALRQARRHGTASAEVIGIGEAPRGDDNDRPLLVPLVAGGERVDDEPLDRARERLLQQSL